jgi:hypothetical protein
MTGQTKIGTHAKRGRAFFLVAVTVIVVTAALIGIYTATGIFLGLWAEQVGPDPAANREVQPGSVFRP